MKDFKNNYLKIKVFYLIKIILIILQNINNINLLNNSLKIKLYY